MKTAVTYPNLVLSFVIEHDGDLLVIRRAEHEENYPGLWAPPGGKVEVGETLVDGLRREVAEETGLEIRDEFALIDAYCFGESTCVTALVRATGRDVVSEEFDEHRWISDLDGLKDLERIKGIDYHYKMAWDFLKRDQWQSLEEFQLKYE